MKVMSKLARLIERKEGKEGRLVTSTLSFLYKLSQERGEGKKWAPFEEKFWCKKKGRGGLLNVYFFTPAASGKKTEKQRKENGTVRVRKKKKGETPIPVPVGRRGERKRPYHLKK